MTIKSLRQQIIDEYKAKFLNHTNEFINPWKFRGVTPDVRDLTSLANGFEDFLSTSLSKVEEEVRKEKEREIVTLKADIAHAIGYCRGLGKPNTYLEKKYKDILPTKKGTNG